MEKKSEFGFYGILAAALLALAGAGWFYYSRTHRTPDPAPAETQQDFSWLTGLDGNYAMRQEGPDGTTYTSATFRRLPDGECELVEVTVYGPVHHTVQLFDDGSLLSEDLGAGFAAYDPALGLYTLRFEKEQNVCILTK